MERSWKCSWFLIHTMILDGWKRLSSTLKDKLDTFWTMQPISWTSIQTWNSSGLKPHTLPSGGERLMTPRNKSSKSWSTLANLKSWLVDGSWMMKQTLITLVWLNKWLKAMNGYGSTLDKISSRIGSRMDGQLIHLECLQPWRSFWNEWTLMQWFFSVFTTPSKSIWLRIKCLNSNGDNFGNHLINLMQLLIPD